MEKKKNILIIVLIALHIISICIFCNIDKIRLMKNGLRYQLSNMEYLISSQTITDDVSFDIDIKNLNSLQNKIIYENDGCTITLDSISKFNGKYILYFSSHGTYNEQSGKLVTAIEHIVLPTKEISDKIHASCFIDDIECQNYSLSAINFKDGDEFSFGVDEKVLENGKKLFLKNLILIEMKKGS